MKEELRKCDTAPPFLCIFHQHPFELASFLPIWLKDLLLSIKLVSQEICWPSGSYKSFGAGDREWNVLEFPSFLCLTDSRQDMFHYNAHFSSRRSHVWLIAAVPLPDMRSEYSTKLLFLNFLPGQVIYLFLVSVIIFRTLSVSHVSTRPRPQVSPE